MLNEGVLEGSEELVHVHRETVRQAVDAALVEAASGVSARRTFAQGSAPASRYVGGRVTATGFTGTWRFGDKLNGAKKLAE